VAMNNIVSLKSGQWNWYRSKAWLRFPIRLPL